MQKRPLATRGASQKHQGSAACPDQSSLGGREGIPATAGADGRLEEVYQVRQVRQVLLRYGLQVGAVANGAQVASDVAQALLPVPRVDAFCAWGTGKSACATLLSMLATRAAPKGLPVSRAQPPGAALGKNEL
jgi:hypothetical protein